MAKNDLPEMIGKWAFLIGVLIAIVFGAWSGYKDVSMNSLLIGLLVVIGLVVGFLNIAGKEVTPFLMSGAVLIIAASLGGSQMNMPNGILEAVLSSILSALLTIFVPATIIVAVKNVFSLAKDK